ncbi:hypothetical protein MNBD_ALPHA01-206 [hydrothermal vent metagenome]|uniref:DUF547 domain-containing protein n=1 Tax=hydrothermal vent metagenome TaxID=652676 RepID=A0A3B0RDK4_9ZZZZ
MLQYPGKKSLKWLLVFLLITFTPLYQGHAADQVAFSTAKVKTHDPNSKIAIDYSTLTLLLKATVTKARISSRIYAQKSQSSIGTKISFSNKNPTRLEASRTFYHHIGDEELEYVHSLRLGLEALPEAVPFQYLNRDEQLAYWLNLYNITVYEQLARRYPIRKLKKLYKGSRKTPSMWDEKIVTVNGIALSLNDIQYNIIQKTWRDPLVIYGLYQGTIGGPNLRRKAYTGKFVYEQLEDNAEEFVNSLRGMRFKGKDALVSEIYEWNSDLFPNFDHDLRRHLRKYASLRLVTRLDASRKIKTKIYDWHIADVLNGGRSAPGGAGSKNPVAFLTSPGSITADPLSAGGNFTSFGGGSHQNIVMNTAIARNRLPKNAAVFLKEFVERSRKLRNANVTVEEIKKKDLKKIRQQNKSENNTEN